MFGNLRNTPEKVRAANPLPDNDKVSATGDAGRDGYTRRRLRRPANSEIASSE